MSSRPVERRWSRWRSPHSMCSSSCSVVAAPARRRSRARSGVSFTHSGVAAPRLQRAVSLDLRRQRRRPARTWCVRLLLSDLRHRGLAGRSRRSGAPRGPRSARAAAIAGVIGAYFVLLPQSRVLMLVPAPPPSRRSPAVFFLAMFGMLQFLNFVVIRPRRASIPPAASLAGAGAGLAVARSCRGPPAPVVW